MASSQSHADDPQLYTQPRAQSTYCERYVTLLLEGKGISLTGCSPERPLGVLRKLGLLKTEPTWWSSISEAYQGQQRAVGRGCAGRDGGREEVSEEENESRDVEKRRSKLSEKIQRALRQRERAWIKALRVCDHCFFDDSLRYLGGVYALHYIGCAAVSVALLPGYG